MRKAAHPQVPWRNITASATFCAMAIGWSVTKSSGPARGDGGRRSDVDVLISVPPAQKFSLLDLAEVRAELCELLGLTAGKTFEDYAAD
jgi:hypothetical protein